MKTRPVVYVAVCAASFLVLARATAPVAAQDKEDRHPVASAKGGMQPASVGQKVPDVELIDLNGKKLHLSDFQNNLQSNKGGVVLLTFWCSFCHSCRRVEARVDKLSEAYRGQVAVIAIDSSAGETAAKVAAFAKKKNLRFPILLDPQGRAADLFGASVTTTSAVIDNHGVLRYCGRFGFGDDRFAEDALQSVLSSKPVAMPTTKHQG